jgi:hypothetical protein
MNSLSKAPILYIVAVAILALSFGLGRYTATPERILAESVRIDTLILRDTVTIHAPHYVHRHTRDTIRISIREVVHDTVSVYLPRETVIYEDARYRAEVSGYEPSLDRIDIYAQTQVVTKGVTQMVKKKTRWGIGISAGYGLAINANNQAITPAPYLGIGIQYNLISW